MVWDKPCKHCRKPPEAHHMKRGLCQACYMRPWIRNRYPSLDKARGERQESRITMEELDAIIAEQMKCLPSWWNKEKANAEVDVGRYGKSGTRVQRRIGRTSQRDVR